MYAHGPYRSPKSSYTLPQVIAAAMPLGDKRNPQARKRDVILLVVESGWSYTHAARQHGVTTKTAIHWVSDFEQRLSLAGVEIILPKNPKITKRDDPRTPSDLESQEPKPDSIEDQDNAD